MKTTERIPWDVLGVPEGATLDDARHAFRRLARQIHPDYGGDALQFAALVDAYREVEAVVTRRRKVATPYDWATVAASPSRSWAEMPSPGSRPRNRPDFAAVLRTAMARQAA